MENFLWLLSWLSTSVATEFFWCSSSKASRLQLVVVITWNLYTLIKSESLLMKWWFFIVSLHLRVTAQYLYDTCYCFVALARLTLAKSPCCFLLLPSHQLCFKLYFDCSHESWCCDWVPCGLVAVYPHFGTEWKWANEMFSVAECVRWGRTKAFHAGIWPGTGCTCWNDIHTGLLTYAYLLLKYSFRIGITDKIGIFFLICIQISTACLLTCSHQWAFKLIWLQ